MPSIAQIAAHYRWLMRSPEFRKQDVEERRLKREGLAASGPFRMD